MAAVGNRVEALHRSRIGGLALPADLALLVEKLPNPPLAFGANCGVGSSDLLRTVLGFFAQGTERPVIAKGNAGIPKYHDGHIHYDGTPELMAEYAVLEIGRAHV